MNKENLTGKNKTAPTDPLKWCDVYYSATVDLKSCVEKGRTGSLNELLAGRQALLEEFALIDVPPEGTAARDYFIEKLIQIRRMEEEIHSKMGAHQTNVVSRMGQVRKSKSSGGYNQKNQMLSKFIDVRR